MLARKYTTKIEIYKNETLDDGFGGLVPIESLVKAVWANISTSAGSRFKSFGIQDFKTPVVFSMRGRKNQVNYNENYFVFYKNQKFYIKGIEDVDLQGEEINLYCDSL